MTTWSTWARGLQQWSATCPTQAPPVWWQDHRHLLPVWPPAWLVSVKIVDSTVCFKQSFHTRVVLGFGLIERKTMVWFTITPSAKKLTFRPYKRSMFNVLTNISHLFQTWVQTVWAARWVLWTPVSLRRLHRTTLMSSPRPGPESCLNHLRRKNRPGDLWSLVPGSKETYALLWTDWGCVLTALLLHLIVLLFF